MTLKKRIKRKAKETFGGDAIFNERRLGFIEGAEWLLNHQWISVKDELPKTEGDEDIMVYVLADVNGKKLPCVASYANDGNGWILIGLGNYDKVTHWMPVPKLTED